MTGLELAQRYGANVAVVDGMDAMGSFFAWKSRVVVLARCVAIGSDAASLAIAAHETAHSMQPRWMWPFYITPPVRWRVWLHLLAPVRWYVETDAWRRAVVLLKNVDAPTVP